MTKINANINKSIIQMIIDRSDGKCNLKYGVSGDYTYVTDGHVLYRLQNCDCYCYFPIDCHMENITRLIPANVDGAKIDTSVVYNNKFIDTGKTFNNIPVGIDIKLLKGFGKNFTIKETDSNTMFSVWVNGTLYGFVCGCKMKGEKENV